MNNREEGSNGDDEECEEEDVLRRLNGLNQIVAYHQTRVLPI